MGGGSDTPDTPDLSPITDIFKQVADWSMKNAQGTQHIFEDAYKRNQGIADKFTDKMLTSMDTWLGEADHQLERYHKYGEPLEQDLYKEAASYRTPARLEYEAAKRERDVAAKFETARDTARDRLEAYGVDPSQTRQQALDLGTRVAEGAASAAAGNAARDQAEAIGRQLRTEAIQTARGGAQMGAQAAQLGTGMGTQALNSQLATTASGAQTLGTPLAWTGAQTQAAGGWGDVLNADFKNRMEKSKADQESSSGLGSILGFAGNLASKFILEDGGAIPEPGDVQSFAPGGTPVPAAASPSNGAVTDDINAQIGPGGPPAQINAGEFILPKDVASWIGEKGLQALVMKSRKEMANGAQRPAQPSVGPPPPGAIPEPQMAMG